MFKEITMDQVNKHISFAGKSSVFKGDNTIPELQCKGVTALCKILHNRKYAYLADEVGMGKTYQAIGVISMLLAENDKAKVLVIAPNEAVQKNWVNEIENFKKNNLLYDMNYEIMGSHPDDIIKTFTKGEKKVTIYIVRLTAFSTIGERVAKQGNNSFVYRDNILSEDLFKGLSIITGQNMEVSKECYNSFDAGKICGSVFREYSPNFDLVVIDEAQNIRNENNATAFFNYWMGLQKFKNDTSTKVGKRLELLSKDNSKIVGRKYLLLSATPAHRGVESLRKQLLYFENEKKIPQIDHDYLEQFMIRRLRTYNGDSKYAVRNVHTNDVAKNLNIKQRLFLALIQSKLAQIQSANNSTFKIGFLETFESYESSSDAASNDDETGEINKEFENGGSSYEGEKGSAKDKKMLQSLAKSYAKVFEGQSLPPHPKLNFMEDEVRTFLKSNLVPSGQTNVPDKAIIFVRRLASVDELVNRRLNRMYENGIVSYWGKRFGINNSNLQVIQRRFEELYKKITVVTEEEVELEDIEENDKNEVKSLLLSWIAVKRKDKKSAFSSVSLFKKTLMRNKTNSFLFDENYYRTAHINESKDEYKKRVERIVNSGFVTEVCEYIEADTDRYTQERNGKRQFNTSNLMTLCCYVALLHEHNSIANKIYDYYLIKDKVESKEQKIEASQIIKILCQTSLWNCLIEGDKHTGNIFASWFSEEKFCKREALKSWIEKYLKSSEAILEIMYCYCNMRGRNNRLLLCRDIWKALYSKECSHGQRIRQLLDNADLVCNQLLGGNEIDYTYDPAFMNLQQWVMPATGGNKGNEALIRRFNTPFYPDIIVCTDVLKEGINLHLFCNRVYHYGLAWTPGDLEQRIGRVDRFFSKTHRERMNEKDTHVEVNYPYMGKSVDEHQLRKVLQFKLSADPLLDSTGDNRKDIEIDLSDSCTVAELAKYVPSQSEQTNLPYSGDIFLEEK